MLQEASRGERGGRALRGRGECGADRPRGASRTHGRPGSRQPLETPGLRGGLLSLHHMCLGQPQAGPGETVPGRWGAKGGGDGQLKSPGGWGGGVGSFEVQVAGRHKDQFSSAQSFSCV